MQPAFMPQRSARLQYALLALVALLALTHVYRGATNSYQNLTRGQYQARRPFFESYFGPLTGVLTPEATAAGLRTGDTVLTLNGRPFTGTNVLLEEVTRSHPGQPLTITYRRADSPPATATVILHAERDVPASTFEWFIRGALFLSAFLFLLAGIYVVLARPRSLNAWLILGILAYFDPLFISSSQMYTHGRLLIQIWGDTAQTAMPLCLMAFGIYFPDRSSIDIRFPWIKWCIAIPIFLLYPTDILYYYGHGFNFAADAWISPWYFRLTVAENFFAALAITYFFTNIGFKLLQSTGDARRRLRVLYYGSIAGLTPFLILLIISLIRKTDVGQGINRWVVIGVLADLLLFPLSLAYVVIVQRALDLRILIRQGTKYAFARQSLIIISVLLAIWMSTRISLFFSGESHRRTIDKVQIFVIIGLFFAFRFILSKRLQGWLDQHFFREAYSTEQLLSELSDEARNFTEVQPLLKTITQRLSSTLHIERIAVFLRSGDTFQLALATGAALPANHSFALPAASVTITNLSRVKGPSNVYRDDPASWLVDATDTERTALNDLSTELLVPLPGRNRLLGVIALGPKRSEEPYSRTDRQLLQSVASQAGLALENAELLQNLTTEVAQRERVSREIEIAREVQERLFPQTKPHVPGVDLAGYCRPAQAIGGDYYDYFLLPPRDSNPPCLALAIGDISGKGISAALLMASLRASLRSVASLQQGDLASVIRHVNHLVYDSSTTNRYATFFFAEYSPLTRVLTYVNAGHNPPFLLRGAQSIPLDATGTVIGLLPDAEYSQASITLQPGDVLLAFTDGISEAMNHDEDEWGEDPMLASAHTLIGQPDCTHSAQQLLDCILKAADDFTDGAPQHDDMTLLVCTVS
jgi:sigma-B regulation protein RsbU (phosphoserine phosphatase)